jgi:hypothetical protein
LRFLQVCYNKISITLLKCPDNQEKKQVSYEDIKPYQWKPGQSGHPEGRPKKRDFEKYRDLIMDKMGEFIEKFAAGELDKLLSDANVKNNKSGWDYNLARASLTKQGNLALIQMILDRVIGKPKDVVDLQLFQPKQNEQPKMSFEDFCVNADYPKPYPKQIEMKDFAFNSKGARMILGARGYGKTDYITILGAAYQIYCQPNKTRLLIITKSRERNSAILQEIKQACEKAGIQFEKSNASCIRTTGLFGKDHSASAVTIKTVTLRGRHPDLIIMDDPVTEDDASEATRAHVERVYSECLKLTQNLILIGQPVHKFDLYERLRPTLNKMEVVWGEIPELNMDLEAMKLAGVSPESISASFFLKVISEGTVPFDKIRFLDKFPKGESAVAFVDPSFKGGDFTAITIAKAYGEGIAIVGYAWKKAWEHCLDDAAKVCNNFNVKRLAFETNCLGDMPLDLLKKAMQNVRIVGWNSNTNKHSRIMAAGSFAQLIHLSKESNKDYINQVTQYEYKAPFDDGVDSLASCLAWLGLIRGKQ